MTRAYSPLSADGQSILPGLGCSVLLHGGVGLIWLLTSLIFAQCGPSRPIIDLDQTMEVSLLAASDLPLPERATRAPVPRGAPDPVPAPAPDTPPPVESDLSYKTPDAKPVPKGTSDVDAALEELERQRMLEELMSAPEGTTNRQATDPNGTGDVTLNPGGNLAGDPELAAYLAKLKGIFLDQFRPLQSIKEQNPGAVCTVRIMVDPESMRVTSHEIVRSSGVPAFDAAAERAAAAVPTLPAPPDKYRALLAEGYLMNFKAND